MIIDRAITLTQPWASLMAIGAKTIETRGRATHYRGWVAIHAARVFPHECREISLTYPFGRALVDAGLNPPHDLPLGKILAVVELAECWTTDSVVAHGLSDFDKYFGDFSTGRYAYLTRGVRRLRTPIPARGFQSIPWKLPTPITEDMLA